MKQVCIANFLVYHEAVCVINQSEFYFQLFSDFYKVKVKMLDPLLFSDITA